MFSGTPHSVRVRLEASTVGMLEPHRVTQVGTPGRILDLSDKGVAVLTGCHTMIMDEADKLLSPEFQPLIEKLVLNCAPDRQICLFSARPASADDGGFEVWGV